MLSPAHTTCLTGFDSRTHLRFAPYDPCAPDITLCGLRAGDSLDTDTGPVIVTCRECKDAREIPE